MFRDLNLGGLLIDRSHIRGTEWSIEPKHYLDFFKKNVMSLLNLIEMSERD